MYGLQIVKNIFEIKQKSVWNCAEIVSIEIEAFFFDYFIWLVN